MEPRSSPYSRDATNGHLERPQVVPLPRDHLRFLVSSWIHTQQSFITKTSHHMVYRRQISSLVRLHISSTIYHSSIAPSHRIKTSTTINVSSPTLPSLITALRDHAHTRSGFPSVATYPPGHHATTPRIPSLGHRGNGRPFVGRRMDRTLDALGQSGLSHACEGSSAAG
jgi:hypothetical protein